MAAVQLLYGFFMLLRISRGLAPSSPLSFCQGFPHFFLQAAESGVLSKLLLTQFDFCGSVFQQFNMT
jgi:hypothetical protein